MICTAVSNTSVLLRPHTKCLVHFLTHFSRVLRCCYCIALSFLPSCSMHTHSTKQLLCLRLACSLTPFAPGRVRTCAQIYGEDEADQHKRLGWKQQPIFVHPPSEDVLLPALPRSSIA